MVGANADGLSLATHPLPAPVLRLDAARRDNRRRRRPLQGPGGRSRQDRPVVDQQDADHCSRRSSRPPRNASCSLGTRLEANGGGSRERKPDRTYLDTAVHIGALLDAAGELDAEAQEHPQPEKRLVPRRAILATLALAGPRIGELCALRWRDVDLAAGRIKVGAAKTDAGRRDIRLLAALRDELAALRSDALDPRLEGYVFATARAASPRSRTSGTGCSRRRSSGPMPTSGRLTSCPLPDGLTPHGLRRTFASVLYALGESPAEVMAQMGHTDPGLALRLYARAMRLDDARRGAYGLSWTTLIGQQWAARARQRTPPTSSQRS